MIAGTVSVPSFSLKFRVSFRFLYSQPDIQVCGHGDNRQFDAAFYLHGIFFNMNAERHRGQLYAKGS